MTGKPLWLDFLGNSPLLKHLGEAGLLHDVSALLARARSRDEGNLRKIQTQAKGASLFASHIGPVMTLFIRVLEDLECPGI